MPIIVTTRDQQFNYQIEHVPNRYQQSCKKSANKENMSKTKKPIEFSDAKIGFIGAGRMTEAIIRGLLQYGKVNPSKLHVAAPSTKNLEKLKKLNGEIHVTKRNIDVFGRYDCSIVFLAVHGSVIADLFKNVQGHKQPHPLTTNFIPNMRHPVFVLSLISGFDLNQIKRTLLNPEHPEKYQLEMHRICINQACAYGQGICAVDCEPDGKKLGKPVKDMLTSIAKLEYVPESQMDAVVITTGSGLAFCFYFIMALIDGAVKIGLSRTTAVKMSAKAFQCAAQALLETEMHPKKLIEKVCSPSGAAIYGLHVLDGKDLSSSIQGAVEAADKRLQDLNKPNDQQPKSYDDIVNKNRQELAKQGSERR